MATIKHIFKGESLSMLFDFPVDYDMARIQSHGIWIGGTEFTGVIIGQGIELKLTSLQTDLMSGNQRVSLWIDDTQLGVRKPYVGDLSVSNTNALPDNDSTSEVYDVIVNVDISVTSIEAGDLMFNYVKGDPLTYDDLTPEQIAELQRPATDAIASIQEVELAVETAEGLRVQAELNRHTNTSEAITQANEARDSANMAAGSIVAFSDKITNLSLDIKKNINKRTQNSSTTKSAITFIDDDGADGVLTKLKPLFTSRNAKIGIATRGDSPIILNETKRNELLALQNDNGWEILSHTMTHLDISLITKEAYEDDCRTFINTFYNYGFDVKNIAYPWGKQDSHRSVTERYFQGGFGTGANINDPKKIYNLAINRYGLGSNMSADMNTLASFKTLIDTAKVNDYWLVFMTHCDYTGNDMQLIQDVLDYAISQSIDIVTPSEGLERFGNIIQSGVRLNGNYFNIKPNGYVDTDIYSIPNILPSKLETDPPQANRTHGINIFAANNWSVGSGIVTEYLHAQAWEYQELRLSGSQIQIFIRKWTGLAWRNWEKLVTCLPTFTYVMPARTIPAQTTVASQIYHSSVVLERDIYIASPVGSGLELGLTYNSYSYGNGAMVIRVSNITSSPITMAERTWRISVLKTI